MVKKDSIFKVGNFNDLTFTFNEEVTEVFEDMIDRSVPGYTSSLRLIENLSRKYFIEGTHCYDLGCSLGASSMSLMKAIGKREGQIRYMAVSNTIQRKGLGSAIVSELETIAREKGIQEMVLNARENAISFYLSMGYKETGPYESDTSIPHITMRKKLT